MNNKFNPRDWLNNSTAEPSSRPATSIPSGESIVNGKSLIVNSKLNPDNGQSSIVNQPVLAPADQSVCPLPGESIVNGKSSIVNSKLIDFEKILSLVESSRTDLTANYTDWRDLGFAFADAFGEQGRGYYHRISRFYPGYAPADCDRQYNACLRSHGHGITLKTFFHLAKQAGIPINSPSPVPLPLTSPVPVPEPDPLPSEDPSLFSTPSLPPGIYSRLPTILSESGHLFQDPTEKDVFLIGALAVLSGCLPNISGIYFDEACSPHLYAFITAPAGSGKGRMKWAKYFGQAIHDHLTEQSRAEQAAYEYEMDQYNNLTKSQRLGVEKPETPARRMFYIPANSSSSAFIQALADNNFSGVIFETEADTLAGTFKQEWGNFSDVLRKAFHHENTSLFRRKDREFIEIRDPHLAIALSGTPKQLLTMMPDVENGLFSRFLYYAFEDNSEFKNPFVSYAQVNYTDFFKEKSAVIFELYQQLSSLRQPIDFRLTPRQGQQFTEIFNTMLSRNKLLLGRDFDANIKRLGIITFRVAMILSALRIPEEGNITNPMCCSDSDFHTAITIATTLEKHAIAVFQKLPNNERSGLKQKFYDALPAQFGRQDYLKVAMELGINPKTAEKYINQFRPKLLNHERNSYTKITS